MNSLIINGDILSICKLCVSYKHTKAAISKIKVNVVKIFSNTFSGSKNTYIARFLSSRLNQLETCSPQVYNKILCEIFVFLGTINKPSSYKGDKGFESNPMDKIYSSTGRDVKQRCVNSILRDNRSDDFILWDMVLKNTDQEEYVHSLQHMWAIHSDNTLLYMAFDTFYESHYYSSSIYNKIIFQCMIKLQYLKEDDSESKLNTYITCLNYEPKKTITLKQFNLPVFREEIRHISTR